MRLLEQSSYQGEGEEKKEGLTPLLLNISPLPFTILKGRGLGG
jgi:hypothetical protein